MLRPNLQPGARSRVSAYPFLFSLPCLVGLGVALLSARPLDAQPPLLPSPVAGADEIPALAESPISEDPLAAAPQSPLGPAILFSTYTGIDTGPWTVLSQQFLGVFIDPPDDTVTFRAVGADDFEVTGDGWRSDQIEVRGTYFNGPGPAESFSVYFFADAGGRPPSTDLAASAIRAYEAISYDEIDFGDPRIPLVDGGGNPDPLFLPPGTYWVAVQANMAFTATGQWGWTESADGADSGLTVGAESHWFQNFPAVQGTDGNTNCVGDWGPRFTECRLTRPGDATAPERDFALRLSGEVLTATVAVSPTTVETSEAGLAASFEVRLTAPPTATVEVPIGAAPATEGVVSATSLTFGPGDWSLPQTVSIQPVDDAVAEAPAVYSLVNGPTTSGDLRFDNLPVPGVDVTHLDDEQAGVSAIAPGSLSLLEGGPAGTFQVRLNSPLAAGQVLDLPLTATPPGLVAVPATVQLTASDGTNPVAVPVTPIDDQVDRGSAPFQIVTGDPSSSNPVYDALGAADVPDLDGILTDNDMAGFVLALAGGAPATTAENGSEATFTVALTSEPLASVTVELFSSDPTEASIDTASLSFDPGNWSDPQTVRITGLDDPFDDGDTAYSVVLAPAQSTDPGYTDRDPSDVAAVNLDDDTASILVLPAEPILTDETGTTAVFTVVLTAEPNFPVVPVTVPLTVGDPTEGEISGDGSMFGPNLDLLFDDTDWDQPQTVWVRGLDDPLLDGDQLYLIETGDVTAGDPAYNGLEAGGVDDVTVINADDEDVTEVPTLGTAFLAVFALLLAVFSVARLRH
ncbi:MAG: hypothetical protein MI919_12810 [Holophagales bacterium]|nr:hypothetical protein [Holophagales bacterium]